MNHHHSSVSAGSGRAELASTSSEEVGNSTMKRAVVQQLVKNYFLQLTAGCGRSDCTNSYCASSSSFVYGKPLAGDNAAAQALILVHNRAPSCEHLRKLLKRSTEEENSKEVSISNTLVAEEDSESDGMGSGCYKSAKTDSSPPPKQSGTSVFKNNIAINSTFDHSHISSSCSRINVEITDDKIKDSLDLEVLQELCSSCQAKNNWTSLIKLVGGAFRNCDVLTSSFLMPFQKEQMRSMEEDADKDIDDTEYVIDMIDEDRIANFASVLPDININAVRNSFGYLFNMPELPFVSALCNAVEALTADAICRPINQLTPFINVVVILMELPLASVSELLERIIPNMCKIAAKFNPEMQAKLVKMWAKFDSKKLQSMVGFLQQFITLHVLSTEWSREAIVNDDLKITNTVKLLKILYYASIVGGRVDSSTVREAEKKAIASESVDTIRDLLQLLDGASGMDKEERGRRLEDPLEKELGVTRFDCREPLVSLKEFINEPLSDVIEMDKDYLYFRTEAQDKFTFMLHSFILTTVTKNLGMYYDNRIRMLQERRQSFLQTILVGQPTLPHLRLHIRRDHIIDDALIALEMVAQENPEDLKKQLYVEFEGEQGVDEGGLSKEFFQLAIEELFNPDYGMFIWSEETRTFWFNPTSFENDGQFTLIGILLGLAIYNSIILDVHFPMVVYRKLLGKLGTFDDLLFSHPSLARGLKQMLEYDEDDFEDVFPQTFCISYKDVFGNELTQDLKPDGANINVNKHNKQEYVDLYANFLLNENIASQFHAFQRGFRLVTDESPLKLLFLPEEVEQLICGSRLYDFHALEKATNYDGGFSSDSPTVRHFWDVVHNHFNDDQRRKLLEFATGSDRVPLGGLAKLKLIIARHGPDSDRLPTAHTCYNVLLFPDYANKEKLQERLLKAIHYTKGFGML